MKPSGMMLLASLSLLPTLSSALPSAELATRRAAWALDSPVLGGGGQEAFIFRVRRGGPQLSTDEWRSFLEEHTAEYVQAYKDAGIEIFHTHGYKGFGYEAEKPEMELLKKLSPIVHGLGMKMSCYCQGMTLAPENFFAELPESKDWVQYDAAGKPVMLNYGFQQSFRYKPNLAHPGYRKYYNEKIVRTLVRDCGADMLFIDNLESNREPESDHSPVAVAAFRDYLHRKYTPDELQARFGHTSLGFITPPIWNRENDPELIGRIDDPVQQEWIDFRCWLTADWIRDVAGYARGLNPEVSITTNPHGLIGTNRAFQVGVWHPWFMKYTEATYSEEENPAEYNERGVIISKFRSYKLGRAFGNRIITNKHNDGRSVAEALAFCGNYPVRIGLDRDSSGYSFEGFEKQYLDFYLAHREFYRGSRTRADVAVLRSYPTMAYHNHSTELEVSMVEQALFQGHVPFDIIFDEQMDSLSKYRALVLAGQDNLSEENVKRIAEFVRGGGGLVATGASGFHDRWGRSRPRPALCEELGQEAAWEYESAEYLLARGKLPRKVNGRAVYIPEVIPPAGIERAAWPGSWDGGWVLPRNWVEIASAVRRAAGGSFSCEADLPEWIALETTVKDKLVLVHFVNYRHGYVHRGFTMEVRTAPQARVKRAYVISPDRPGVQKLEFNPGPGWCGLTVPELVVYDVVVIELEK